MKIGYKVVGCHRRSSGVHESEKLMYKKGKRVVPVGENGPLAVFKTFKYAKNFVGYRYTGGFQILKCEYVPSSEKELYIKELGMIVLFRTKFPRGTALAESVTCLE